MNPVADYLSVLLRHGAAPRYYPRVPLYLFKLAVWEPFRHAEGLLERLRGEPKDVPTDPVFILGYYRSGTTHLQQTLLQDPAFGYMNFYQGFFPTAFTSTERWLKPVFEQIMTRSGYLLPAHKIPFTFTLPCEEDVSMIASGFRLAANWGQVLPRGFKDFYGKTGFMEGITPAELAAWKAEHRRLIWRVSKANGHKRLLLKSPPHTGRVGTLLDMYPNAKFIFIHRNPYDVFASNKTLWTSFSETWLEDIGPETVQDNILWAYDTSHANYVRDRERMAPGQLCEVAFDDFIAAPTDTLERIYDTLGLGDYAALAPRFEAYLSSTHARGETKHLLTDAERTAIAARWARWLDHFGYPVRKGARGAA